MIWYPWSAGKKADKTDDPDGTEASPKLEVDERERTSATAGHETAGPGFPFVNLPIRKRRRTMVDIRQRIWSADQSEAGIRPMISATAPDAFASRSASLKASRKPPIFMVLTKPR